MRCRESQHFYRVGDADFSDIRKKAAGPAGRKRTRQGFIQNPKPGELIIGPAISIGRRKRFVGEGSKPAAERGGRYG